MNVGVRWWSWSNMDNLIRRDVNKVEWVGWHLISYATVMTMLDPFTNPFLFVDKSKEGNAIRWWISVASFSCPSGLCLLLWLWIMSSPMVFWNAMKCSLVRSTFISIDDTLFFAMYWSVRPVLMYLRNPILASRWVENILKLSHVLKDWRVDMILCSPNSKAETCMFEWISWWTQKRGLRGFLLVITSKFSMYAVLIGNSPGWLMVVSLTVMDSDGSRIWERRVMYGISREDLRSYLSQSYRMRRWWGWHTYHW